MRVPFFAPVPPLRLGVIGSGTTIVPGHVLMLPEPYEYVHGHGGGTHR